MKKLAVAFYRWLNCRLAIRDNVKHCGDLRVGIGTTLRAPDALSIGRKVKIGAYTLIACNGSIGNGVLISSHVGIAGRYDHDHRAVGKYISESPWLYGPDARPRDGRDAITIEDDVWVGFGAIILSGITVGRSAVIAAGAVVTKNVEPYAIVAGNPAKKIGMRFTDAQQREHEALLRGQ